MNGAFKHGSALLARQGSSRGCFIWPAEGFLVAFPRPDEARRGPVYPDMSGIGAERSQSYMLTQDDHRSQNLWRSFATARRLDMMAVSEKFAGRSPEIYAPQFSCASDIRLSNGEPQHQTESEQTAKV